MKIAGLQITSGTITENSSIGSTVSIAGVNVSGTTFLPTTSGDVTLGIVIATSAFCSTNYAVTANQAINFDTIVFDTASGVIQGNGMITVGAANTWKFTAPVSGIYQVNCLLRVGAVAADIKIFKNGVAILYLMNPPGQDQSYTGSAIVKLIAGDFISINPAQSVTLNGSSTATASNSQVHITRLR